MRTRLTPELSHVQLLAMAINSPNADRFALQNVLNARSAAAAAAAARCPSMPVRQREMTMPLNHRSRHGTLLIAACRSCFCRRLCCLNWHSPCRHRRADTVDKINGTCGIMADIQLSLMTRGFELPSMLQWQVIAFVVRALCELPSRWSGKQKAFTRPRIRSLVPCR